MSHNSSALASRRPGLDVLRLVAALLIFAQHSFSASHHDSWIDIAGFRVGRIGTSLFFMLAGLLAASSTRPPLVWFRDRLFMLFPTFWVVTIAGFVVAAVTGSKPFDTWQIICQMSGIGYFTHGERMVNVATWFLTPLLVLYLAALIARLIKPVAVSLMCVAGCVAFTLLSDSEPNPVVCHAVTFFTAFALGGLSLSAQRKIAIVAAAIMLTLQMIEPEYRYGAVSLLMLAAFNTFSRPIRACQSFTLIAYEWFLVHGLCIVLVTRCVENILFAAPIGAVTSVAAAWMLKKLVATLRTFRRRNHSAIAVPADNSLSPAVPNVWCLSKGVPLPPSVMRPAASRDERITGPEFSDIDLRDFCPPAWS